MKLTIGFTINLQNYEFLRVEATDESGDDVALKKYLRDVVSNLGRQHEEKKLIDSFTYRILGDSDPEHPESSGQSGGSGAKLEQAIPSTQKIPPDAPSPSYLDEINEKYKGKVSIETGMEIHNKTRITCAKCGKELNPKEIKISDLFFNVPLCMEHMKSSESSDYSDK